MVESPTRVSTDHGLDELRDLLDGPRTKFYICNTDRRNSIPRGSDELEGKMRNRGLAAAWEQFSYRGHMERVDRGDAIFMFAKGVGIVGIGRAKGPCRQLPPGDARRIGGSSKLTEGTEWQIDVEWLDWSRNHPCPISEPPQVTFKEITKDKLLRYAVREHFLGRT